ncbi:MAG: hypothetical protein V4681_02195 [Patescibacteria group bacterium]
MSTTLPMTGQDPLGDLVKLMQRWYDDGMPTDMIVTRIRAEGKMYKEMGVPAPELERLEQNLVENGHPH